MALEGYAGARSQSMEPASASIFENGIRALRETVVAHGFSKETADSLSFNVKEYTLTISSEEAQSGASHMFADGKPFYAISVQGPGSLVDIKTSPALTPLEMAPRDQAIILAFEIGMNLMSNMGTALQGTDVVTGGTSFSPASGVCDTFFRNDPELYMLRLNTLLNMRLDMIAPKSSVPASKNNGPKI